MLIQLNMFPKQDCEKIQGKVKHVDPDVNSIQPSPVDITKAQNNAIASVNFCITDSSKPSC